mgnify:CR=1
MGFIIVATLAALSNPYLFVPAILIGLASRSAIWVFLLSSVSIATFIVVYFEQWPGLLFSALACLSGFIWAFAVFAIRRKLFDPDPV